MLDKNRNGKFTASQISRLIPNGKADFNPERVGGRGAGYSPYLYEKPYTDQVFDTVAEYEAYIREERARLSGNVLSEGAMSYVTETAMQTLFAEDEEWEQPLESIHMRRGNERELAAIAQFEMATGLGVDFTGEDQVFVSHDCWGATPDGVISINGKRATIDVKAPMRVKHLKYMLEVQTGEDLLSIEPAYYWQQQCQIAALSADYGYWVSYNPMAHKYDNRIHIVKVERNEDHINLMLNKIALATEQLELILKKYGE
jgi:hypothetical protein